MLDIPGSQVYNYTKVAFEAGYHAPLAVVSAAYKPTTLIRQE